MVEVRFAEGTADDFERIHSFYSNIDLELGARALLAIREQVRLLSTMPEIGRREAGAFRLLPIRFGRGGFQVRYEFVPQLNLVLVLAIRHQREQEF
jgi:plasmid stabilization system protein ParE